MDGNKKFNLFVPESIVDEFEKMVEAEYGGRGVKGKAVGAALLMFLFASSEIRDAIMGALAVAQVRASSGQAFDQVVKSLRVRIAHDVPTNSIMEALYATDEASGVVSAGNQKTSGSGNIPGRFVDKQSKKSRAYAKPGPDHKNKKGQRAS